MVINRSIPGQMTDAELARLIELAAAVPPNGIIVEVGSLYGLSSWHIAQHCHPTVAVFCVDPWQPAQWITDNVQRPQNALPFGRAAFEHYTADCKNIVMLQGYSPKVALGWRLPIDLYVEDAIHSNPVLKENIEFWSSFVKPGGVISGHDYISIWPDVISEADRLAKKFQSELRVVGSFWSVVKPDDDGFDVLADRLEDNDQRQILITYHGTVVYFDTDERCLRHSAVGTIGANVYAVRVGEGTFIFWQDGETARPLGHFDMDSCALAVDGCAVCLVETVVENGLVAFAKGDYFLCAEADGKISCSRLRVQTWESFAAIAADDFANIDFIFSNKWLRRLPDDSFDLTDAELLQGFKVRIGRVILPITDLVNEVLSEIGAGEPPRDLWLNFDHWKVDSYVLYRPLAYFVAFGKDEIFTLLEMAVRSLFQFGNWQGDILVITDELHVAYIHEILSEFLNRVHVATIQANDTLDFTLARYKAVHLDITLHYQPLIYLDVDIICDMPLTALLFEAALSPHFHVFSEDLLVLSRSRDYFGQSLLEQDGIGYDSRQVGISSGVFAFKDAKQQRTLFDLILQTAERWAESTKQRFIVCFDQPFLNYILSKAEKAERNMLTDFVHLQINDRARLKEPVGKGLVHFAGGVGNALPKLEQMRGYIEILRSKESDDLR